MYYEGDVFYLKKIVFLVSDDIYIYIYGWAKDQRRI